MGKKLQKYLIHAYSKKIERDPDSLFFMPLANEYKNCGRLQDAIRLVRNGLRNYPYYTGARALAGELLFLSGELGEAESELKAVAEKSPGHVLSRRILFEIYQKSGKNQEALQCARELARLCPDTASRFAELKTELGGWAGTEDGRIKKGPAQCEEESGFSNVADSDSLSSLEKLYQGIRAESESRHRNADSLNDSPLVDWTAFHENRGSGDSSGSHTSAPSREKQLEIFEKMFFNIKKRVGRN